MNDSTLLMPFLDESLSFTNGFECGRIWNEIEQGNTLDCYLIHIENRRQIEMICEMFGVSPIFTPAAGGWAYLTVESIIK